MAKRLDADLQRALELLAGGQREEIDHLLNLVRRQRREADLDRRDRALREIRDDLLPNLATRAAAREIFDAARNARIGSQEQRARRAVLRSRLTQALGDLGCIPGERRIRQVLENEGNRWAMDAPGDCPLRLSGSSS